MAETKALTEFERLLPERDLAEFLGVSQATLRDLRAKGAPYVRIGRRVFYHDESFVGWLVGEGTRNSTSRRPTSARETT